MKEKLRNLIGDNENILYEGKPNKKCFLLHSIFNFLLPFSILWTILFLLLVGIPLFSILGDSWYLGLPLIVGGLMPVWWYLSRILFVSLRYKNTQYIVTDHAIYISKGIFSKHFNTKSFSEMSHINLYIGKIEKKYHTGSIMITADQMKKDFFAGSICIANISEYEQVYELIKQLQMDIYSDVMYPNDKRPPENHG